MSLKTPAAPVDVRDSHHRLMERARAFAAAVEADERGHALEVLRELGAGIALALLGEERSMRRAEYPSLEAHAAAHGRFLRHLRQLEVGYVNGLAPAAAREAYEVLLAQVAEHLGTLDAAFERFLRDHKSAA